MANSTGQMLLLIDDLGFCQDRQQRRHNRRQAGVDNLGSGHLCADLMRIIDLSTCASRKKLWEEAFEIPI
jgi:hypothetical protein